MAGTAVPGMAGTAAPGMAGTAAPGMAGTAAPGMAGTAAPGMAGTAAPGVAGTAAPGVAGTVAPGVAGTVAPGVAGTAAPAMSGTMSGGTAAPAVSGGSGGTTVASSGTSPGTVTQTVELTGMTLPEANQMASSAEFKTNQRTEYATAAGKDVKMADVDVTNTASAARRLAEHMILSGRSLAAAGKLVSVFTITVPAGVTLDSVQSAVSGAQVAIQTAMKTAVTNTAAFANVTVTATADTPTKTAAVSPTPAPAPPNAVGGACGSQLAPLVLLAILSWLLF